MNIFRNFDQISFWLGFLTASILWFLIGRLLPWLRESAVSLRSTFDALQDLVKADLEIKYRNELIENAQKCHIASPLFLLEEILIPPFLLLPPPTYDPENEVSNPLDIVHTTLPYMPDWPELGSLYGGSQMTIPEAMQKGADLAIIGPTGIGKTVALNHLAISVARRDPDVESLHDLSPFLVHAADFDSEKLDGEDLLAPLLEILTPHFSRRTAGKIPEILNNAFKQGSALFILDGLDELDRASIDDVVNYLGALKKNFPGTRVVAAASIDYYGGLTKLGLFPIAMTSWNQVQKTAFIELWQEMWLTHVDDVLWHSEQNASSLAGVLNQWLLEIGDSGLPLDFTLKTWAVYAGDSLGSNPSHGISAYIRRMTSDVRNGIAAMERLGGEMVLTLTPVPKEQIAGDWVRDPAEPDIPIDELREEVEDSGIRALTTDIGTVRKKVIADLIEKGLLTPRNNDRLSFTYAAIGAFLAGQSIANTNSGNVLNAQPPWAWRRMALESLSIVSDVTILLRGIIQNDDPLNRGLLSAARWIRSAPENAQWRKDLMRRLAGAFQDNILAFGIRARALSGLLSSGDPTVTKLLRRLLASPNEINRQLALLGLGFLSDDKSLHQIADMLVDTNSGVQRAACLALAAIGEPQAIDNVATALLQGSESLQRAASEALANNVGEGHLIIKEASTVEDLLVRRAAVFGLARIRQPWSREVLRDMQHSEEQWVVRNAAAQTYTMLEEGSPFSPKPYKLLHESEWMIAFAAEQGKGVSPGPQAREMLHTAMQNGNEIQILTAMQRIGYQPDETPNPAFYKYLFGNEFEQRETAFLSLWYMGLAGIRLPAPTQYGHQVN